MAINPCCCCCGISLETGTKIIAFLQIIGALAIFITSILAIVGLSILAKTELDNETSEQREARHMGEIALIVVASILLVGSTVAFVFAVVLWKGASQRDARKCSIWIFISCTILIVFVVAFILDCINVRTGEALLLLKSAGTILVDAYCIFVVFCFRRELKEENAAA